ncbi:MAG: tyrosine-type recombinase/integrase [Bacillota bacterium]
MGRALTGSVYRRGDTWAVLVDVGQDPATGRRKRHYKGGFKTKREAEAYKAQVLVELQRGAFVEPAKITVAEYAERWLASVKPNLAPRTWQGYELNLRKHVLPFIGQAELSKLQPLALQGIYSTLLERGLAPRTVLYVHRTLHRMLEMAVKWGLVGRNVADAVEPPKQQRKEPQVLDEEQAGRLMAGISDLRLLVPVAIALGTGLRRGEVLGLKWQDVDLEAHCIHILQTVQRLPGEGIVTLPTKTNKSRRTVIISPGLVDILRAWRKQQLQERLAAGPLWRDTGFVCTAPDGGPLDPDWLTKAFARTVRALGLPPVRFHDLRHSQATYLLKRGVHPKVVQERLGHSSITVTMDIYSHVLPTMQKEAARAVDPIFSRAAAKWRT